MQSQIRTGLAAAPPEQAAEIVDLLDRLETVPGGWDAISGEQKATARLAVDRYRAGMPGPEAITTARADSDPNNQAVIEARRKALKAAKVEGNYGNWAVNSFDAPGPFNRPDLAGADLDRAAGDFGVLYEQAFLRTGDQDAAKALATEDFRRVWGVTGVDGDPRVTRYPPEAWFGLGLDPADDSQWMGRQLQADLAALGAAPAGGVTLQADAMTARHAGTQAGPSWLVLTTDEFGLVQPLLGSDGKALRWRPDPKQADAALVAAARERRKEEAAKARMLNRPGPFSGAAMQQREADMRAAGGGDAVRP